LRWGLVSGAAAEPELLELPLEQVDFELSASAARMSTTRW
jgi:hypothetical protein